MKWFTALPFWILFLLSLVLTAPSAQADIDGFKGMRWGSTLSEIQQTKKLALTKAGGANDAALYALENEELRFGAATLTGIHCSFTQERLQGVILLFTGAENFAAVKAEAFARFGESKKFEQGGEEMYNWVGTVTNSVLSYNPASQSGFLFMKPKKMTAAPEPAATPEPAAKQPAGKPVELETALDRASPPSAPAKSSQVEHPAELETELDRASAPPILAENPRAESPAEWETALDRASEAPMESPVRGAGDFGPEIQALIDRDQALTRLCWGTTGPEAIEACRQMRQSVQQLTAMGMCMSPAAPGRSESEVVWSRCGAPAARTPSGNEGRAELCGRIGEMFATAAQLRNDGASPGDAEEELVWYQTGESPEITTERIRETVELVFFDQHYAQASGEQLKQQVRARCLSGNGPYAHPLP